MRWLLLTAFVVSAGFATYTEFQREREIRIAIDVGYALPDIQDASAWRGRLNITVRPRRPCGSLDVKATEQALGASGRNRLALQLQPRGSQVHASGSYDFYEGLEYRIDVTAVCVGGPGDGLRGAAHAYVRAGGRWCEGLVRVLSSRVPATSRGERLDPGERLAVDRPIVVGAPECNGFHATLLPGSTTIGSYAPRGRGVAFSGRRITMSRSDRRGGAFALEGTPLVVRPGRRYGFSSAFAVRSHGMRSVVRVYSGAVDITGAGAARRLHAWDDAFFSCAAGACRLLAVRLVQPGEPLGTDLRPSPRLRTVLPGLTTPPTDALAPPRAATTVTTVRAAGGEPRELVVHWYRETRRQRLRDAQGESGVFVWQFARGAWRLQLRYYATRFAPHVSARVGDVTGDGHEDVLVDRVTGGSGNCGIRTVFASIEGHLRRVYRRDFCEGAINAEGGRLVQTLPVGPCPHHPGSAHCFGGRSITVLRLAGDRLVTVSRTVECALPRLDPRRNCA